MARKSGIQMLPSEKTRCLDLGEPNVNSSGLTGLKFKMPNIEAIGIHGKHIFKGRSPTWQQIWSHIGRKPVLRVSTGLCRGR
jgi:hypothetical protein